jgi:negative regulator of flagellin synthesis FlgM
LAGISSDSVQGTKNPNTQPSGSGVAPNSASIAGEDTVELSGTMGQVQQLNAQLAQMPDVRSERVAALQQQVQQGTYNPSNEQIANAMLSEQSGSGSGN